MSDTDNAESQFPDELTTLKARADLMNVNYHPSIGVDKLREKVAAAQAGAKQDEGPAASQTSTKADEPVAETLAQRRFRVKREATRLVRVNVTCMNPNKKEHDGELLTVSNSMVGTLKLYLPFNTDWHIPQMVLNAMRERRCQVFYTVKQKDGVAMRKGKLIPEFAINVLPDLTEQELKALAQRQAMAAGTAEAA